MDGERHLVEIAAPSFLTGPSRSFAVDGRDLQLGGIVELGDRRAAFEVGGRPATLSRSGVAPSLRTRVQRATGGNLVRLPAAIGSYVVGALGFGDRSAAAASRMLGWTIYSLTVDGVDRGAWVATSVGGTVRRWTFVEPGDPLPTPDSAEWPSARPRPTY